VLLFRARERAARSLVKAVSWRAVGSIDTFLLGWLWSGNAKVAGAIAGTEVFTKIGLYFLHERLWAIIPFGQKQLRGREFVPDAPAITPDAQHASADAPR
jgi:uncharacterized membrane protein